MASDGELPPESVSQGFLQARWFVCDVGLSGNFAWCDDAQKSSKVIAVMKDGNRIIYIEWNRSREIPAPDTWNCQQFGETCDSPTVETCLFCGGSGGWTIQGLGYLVTWEMSSFNNIDYNWLIYNIYNIDYNWLTLSSSLVRICGSQ